MVFTSCFNRYHLAERLSSLLLISSLTVVAQVPAVQARQNLLSQEQRTTQYFESIRQSPLKQLAFLLEMPKGGDIHNHLSGAVYAESYIQWAADQSLCVEEKRMNVTSGPCDQNKGTIPVADALTNQALYDRLVNAWSMRFWQYADVSGHDQFFDAFAKIGEVTDGQKGKMLAETVTIAADNQVNYLELMLTPASDLSKEIGKKAGWDGQMESTWQKLQNSGIAEAVAVGKAEIAAIEAEKNTLLKCGTPQAAPGCGVTVRYIAQVARGSSLDRVFAQMVTGLMLASDPTSKFVGINLVQPEDGLNARQNFRMQMKMLNFLSEKYPEADITLHAGEFFPGLVPPSDRSFHITESVLVGQAKRIGHGVDIMREDEPYDLMKELVKRDVLIEICLGSNDLILGVTGKEHPLSIYLEQGVPMALATDDQGIARSELSEEFLRAARDHGLTYSQLKTLARNSLQYAFIEGESLWQDWKKFTVNPVCQEDWQTGKSFTQITAPACQELIKNSEKARLQWDLEQSFASFESQY